jgi:hypothetical protein
MYVSSLRGTIAGVLDEVRDGGTKVACSAQHRADQRDDEQTEDRAGDADQCEPDPDPDDRDQRPDAQRVMHPARPGQAVAHDADHANEDGNADRHVVDGCQSDDGEPRQNPTEDGNRRRDRDPCGDRDRPRQTEPP